MLPAPSFEFALGYDADGHLALYLATLGSW